MTWVFWAGVLVLAVMVFLADHDERQGKADAIGKALAFGFWLVIWILVLLILDTSPGILLSALGGQR